MVYYQWKHSSISYLRFTGYKNSKTGEFARAGANSDLFLIGFCSKKKLTGSPKGYTFPTIPIICWGWSGDAMVLGKLPVPGHPTFWMIVGQGPIALAEGAGGFFWTFLLSSMLSPLFLLLSGRRPDIDWNTVSKGR